MPLAMSQWLCIASVDHTGIDQLGDLKYTSDAVTTANRGEQKRVGLPESDSHLYSTLLHRTLAAGRFFSVRLVSSGALCLTLGCCFFCCLFLCFML